MQTLPVWRDTPQPVIIEVKMLGESAWPDKVLAEFHANGQKYALIANADFVDQAGGRMAALIVADVGDEGYLVELPGESPSAGSSVFVRHGDVKAWEPADRG